MPNIEKITNSIDKIIHSLLEIKRAFNEDVHTPSASSQATSSQMSSLSEESVAPAADEYDSFEALNKALNSDKWPEAVNRGLICQPDNENDKIDRGKGIVELMIEENIDGLKVLDFGCGEGQCALAASDQQPTLVVGYDISESPKWNDYKKDNLIYTTDFIEVVEHAPYDVIIIFDVLDHIQHPDSPATMLKKAKQVLSEKGKIYMRCHPFTSRHATHLYHELNKAYVHLVFTEEELATILPESKWKEPNIGVTYPIKTYADYINEAGLKVVNRRDIKDKVESFFKIPKIAERIMKRTRMPSFPEHQMSLQFIDYVLEK